MAAALTLLLIGSVLQGALCGEFKVIMPQTIEVVSGSCVTIPCSFDVTDQFVSNLDNTCKALWKKDEVFVFDSSQRQTTQSNGQLTGDLTKKDCTTTLNNIQPVDNNKKYSFRLECRGLSYTFLNETSISVKADPPRPTLTLTPSTLEVKEGTSVSLTCSAPAPCLSHPPNLTWTPGLGDSQETLQENQDKTKVQTSVVSFTASLHLHHGKTISCTATYNKQDGSTESAVSTSLTADISCVLCGEFKVIMPQTIEVVSGSCVTIPCSFDVTDQYVSNLDNTCKALWKKDGVIVFDSSQRQTTQSNGQLTGDLTKKDCTTTLNNIQPVDNNKKYSFRLECRGLGYDFSEKISFSVTADPPRPTLTPSTLEVKEGTSVSLTCSAPAPCLSHPPNLTWTPGLGDSQETLQENQDKTKVQTSVVSFTASLHLHHGKTISCTATYNKQDGSTESAVSTSLTADISCVLCGEFKVIMPQTIEVVSGSCVTIPCSFDVTDQYVSNLDNTCKALWKKDGVIVFDSSQRQTTQSNRQLTGDLTKKDCTTTLNNIQPVDNNKKYSFRLECRGLGYDFSEKISFSVTADPPRPTLTPSTLEVKEGTSVSLTCSAPAPCLSHPPNLTWTPGLGDSQETLQENQDKTKVQTSVVSFTASLHLHHGKTISCTATYNKQDGSTESAVSTSLTANISYSPQKTTVSVHPSGPVSEGRDVTLTCSSSANPPVKTYTWYRANGDQETFIGSGAVLNIKASKDNSLFFCKAQNDLGTARSDNRQIDVQYSPQNTIVSVHPSGPVSEGRDVTLTCSSSANPPVKTYTWYRADGGQETFIGAGAVLNITASKDNSLFFCEAQNDLGAGRSNISQIDVQFSPQILPSSHCTIAEAQLRCSCRTVGNPSPTLQWYLDGSPVNHSFAISNLSDTGLTSNLTVDQPQEKNLSTLLCRSSNSLGSASRHFCVNSIEPQTSAQSQDPVMLPVFITIVGALLVIVCALLFVIRNQKTHYNFLKSQRRGDTSTVTTSQLLSNGEDNQVPNTTEEDIYVNTSELRQADVAQPETNSEPNSTNLPSSGQNNAEGASESSEKKNEEGNDVIYSAVNWKTKSKKKKGDDSLNMNQPGSSYLEEERCTVGGMGRDFVSNALEMECLYDKVKPRNVEKEVEGEYAQVKFKDKRPMHK